MGDNGTGKVPGQVRIGLGAIQWDERIDRTHTVDLRQVVPKQLMQDGADIETNRVMN